MTLENLLIPLVRPVNESPEEPDAPKKYELGNGTLFEGHIVDGYLAGRPQATLTWKQGHRYTGEFKQNKPHGLGSFKWQDGTEYNGEVAGGKRNGFGTLVSSQFSCAGDWKEGRLNGKGKFTNSAGEYDGQWQENRREGEGVSKWSSGNVYEGQYKNGKRNGYGKMIWHSKGQSYEGEWKDGLPHGNGTYIWKSQFSPEQRNSSSPFIGPFRYVGEWKDGKRDGKGTFTYATGSSYRGEWKNNKKHGQGIFVAETGHYLKGEWIEDRFEGKGGYPLAEKTNFNFNLYGLLSSDYVKDKNRYQNQINDINEIAAAYDTELRQIYRKHARFDGQYMQMTRFDVWKMVDSYGLLLKNDKRTVNLVDLGLAYADLYKGHEAFPEKYSRPFDHLDVFTYFDFLQYLIVVASFVYGNNGPENDVAGEPIPYWGLSASFYKLIMDGLIFTLRAKTPINARLPNNVDMKIVDEFMRDYEKLDVEKNPKHILVDLKDRYPDLSDVTVFFKNLLAVCPSAKNAEDPELVDYGIKVSAYDYLLLRFTLNDIRLFQNQQKQAQSTQQLQHNLGTPLTFSSQEPVILKPQTAIKPMTAFATKPQTAFPKN